jgi:hypothetical protein
MVRVCDVTKMAQAMHLRVEARGDVPSQGSILLRDCQFSLPAEIFVACTGRLPLHSFLAFSVATQCFLAVQR